MTEIVIGEVMEQAAVDDLAGDYDPVYEPTPFERRTGCARFWRRRALMVRNRTEVRGAVLEPGDRLEAIGRLGAE